MSDDQEQATTHIIDNYFCKLKEPSAIIANKFLQDENAKLREQLAKALQDHERFLYEKNSLGAKLDAAEARTKFVEDSFIECEERLSEANSKLNALDEQEPIHQCWQASVACWQDCTADVYYSAISAGYEARIVYAEPVPPVAVQELQAEIERIKLDVAQYEETTEALIAARYDKRIAELGRKLVNAIEAQPCNAGACKDEMLWRAELTKAREEGRKEAMPLLLLALYHHQGANSIVGQPIRRLIGMGQYERMTDEQIAAGESAMLASAPKLGDKP